MTLSRAGFLTLAPGRCLGAQLLSHVRHLAVLWTVARQAPLLMGFPRQEYRSRLPFPSPGDLPDPGIEPTSLQSGALAVRLFTTSATGKQYLLKLNMLF